MRLRKQASVHPKTVTGVSTGAVTPTGRRRNRGMTRRRSGPVTVSHWSDGVDPRVVERVNQMIEQYGIDPRCIEGRPPDSVVIHNHSNWKKESKR